MPAKSVLLTPVFLLAQALLALWLSHSERPPAPPNPAAFPTSLAQWQSVREDPIEDAVLSQLGATTLLNRTYVHQRDSSVASLFLAWFDSQSGGNRQPHSPKVCLPGAGWVPVEQGVTRISSAAGEFEAARYIVANRGRRAAVLYWFQTPSRTLSSEWAAKFWLIPDALRTRRTDTALVRLFVWDLPSNTTPAPQAAADLAQHLYPHLKSWLPPLPAN